MWAPAEVVNVNGSRIETYEQLRQEIIGFVEAKHGEKNKDKDSMDVDMGTLVKGKHVKYGKDSKMVKQLDRQIAANRSGQTSQDLYVTGSYKRPTQTV